MNQQLQEIVARLRKASHTHGELAGIAQASGVSSRTIYNLLHKDSKPNLATLEKLEAHFKKADRKKIAKEEEVKA